MKCQNCNAEISDSAKFCPECGSKIERVSHCIQCGTELATGAKFCPECGTPVNASESRSAQPKQEDDVDNLFGFSEEQLDELIGNEHRLISIDSVYPEEERIADVELYPSDNPSDSGFVIIGKKPGNSTIFADFTYRSVRGRDTYHATIAIEVKMTRSGLKDKELGEQLIIDISKYRNERVHVSLLYSWFYLCLCKRQDTDISQKP